MTPFHATRHSLGTRIFHAALALAVMTQLATSLVAEAPSPRHAGNWVFGVHQYVGLAAFAFVLCFWLVVLLRRTGTAPVRIFPWLSAMGRTELAADIKAHLAAFRALRMPRYEEASALASAVHGLGLLLMLAMAGSGALYYVMNAGNPNAGGLVGVAMSIHRSLATLVWAYLIGHAGMAVIHHFTQAMSLTEMWSFGPGRKTTEPAQ